MTRIWCATSVATGESIDGAMPTACGVERWATAADSPANDQKWLTPSRHPQDVLTMVVEKGPLPFREHAHVHLRVRLDPHLQQRRPIRHRRDDQVTFVLE